LAKADGAAHIMVEASSTLRRLAYMLRSLWSGEPASADRACDLVGARIWRK
jgi:hypothetical protein